MRKRTLSVALTSAVLASALTVTAVAAAGNSSAKTTKATVEAEETELETENYNPDDLLYEILDRGYIIVGTEGTYSPNSYHDEETDELVGFDVEVAAVVAEYLGVEVQYKEMEWSSIFAALDAGQIDIVVNEVGYTEERAEKYDFSEPYSFVQRGILVKGDNTDINSFEDLEGKVAANESTSLFGQMAEEYGAELDPVNAMAQSISEVLNGRADATLNYVTSFADYMQEHPEVDVKVVATTDPEPSSYIPVVKGNSALVDAINDALKQAAENGDLKEISEKYYGIDVTDSGEEEEEETTEEETTEEETTEASK